MARQHKCLLLIALVVGLGLAYVTCIDHDAVARPVTIGMTFGTLFGQAVLSGTWTALGPLTLRWRLPLSLAWLGAFIVGLGVNFAFRANGPRNYEFLALLGGSLVALWTLVVVPLGGLAIWHGIRLTHRSEPSDARQPRQRQFSILQLMIVTAVVAGVLSLGRESVAWFMRENVIGGELILAFLFLAVAGVVMMVPLVLAALLPRLALPSTLGILVLIGVATPWETSLFDRLPSAGANFWILLWINGFTALWVIGIIALVRWGGFGLNAVRSPAKDLGPTDEAGVGESVDEGSQRTGRC